MDTHEDKALARIRQLVSQPADRLLILSEVIELCRLVAMLDDWLSSGNTLPEAWQRAKPPAG
jgi:hypothetical protein